jgi:hypothetical protein
VRLPGAANGILDSLDNFISADVSATICNHVSEQTDDFTSGQVCVQLPGDSEEPRVNAFPGSRRRGKHIPKK